MSFEKKTPVFFYLLLVYDENLNFHNVVTCKVFLAWEKSFIYIKGFRPSFFYFSSIFFFFFW